MRRWIRPLPAEPDRAILSHVWTTSTCYKPLEIERSSYRLLAEFPHMRKRFWGRHVWARGYFCRSSGNVTDEVIQAYIAQQSHDSDDVFRIEGEASPPGDTPLGNPS